MLQQPRPWFEAVPWATVLETNHNLFKKIKPDDQGMTPGDEGLQQKGFEAARALWARVVGQSFPVIEALNLCRQCHDLRPFLYCNAETFAVISEAMIDPLLQRLSPVEVRIVANTVRHYVTGAIDRRELQRLFRHLQGQGRTSAARSPAKSSQSIPGTQPQPQTS